MSRRTANFVPLGALLCVVFLTMSWVLPTLMERTVIQKSYVTIPQYCSDPDSACSIVAWNSEEFVLKERETATLQMGVVPQSSSARGDVVSSVYGTSETYRPGYIIGQVFDYRFMGATPRPAQSSSFYVKYTGHYRLGVFNGEDSAVAISFVMKATPYWTLTLLPAVTAVTIIITVAGMIIYVKEIYVARRKTVLRKLADDISRSHVSCPEWSQ